uniref:Cyclic nucleotide-binding domain-containing protein n=1 Tax=Heterorhabditis bacteriophora TaxID=37862 RepID=A0A1I7WWY2_HETBA
MSTPRMLIVKSGASVLFVWKEEENLNIMDPINDARFYESLIKSPQQRTGEDIRNIYEQLRQLDMFSNLYNGPLKAICASARYERHPAHHILFRDGQVATCWYILLSGSVLIEDKFCLPYGCTCVMVTPKSSIVA